MKLMLNSGEIMEAISDYVREKYGLSGDVLIRLIHENNQWIPVERRFSAEAEVVSD